MATRIRATCPVCGDIQLSVEDLTIRTCVGREGGEYRWKCRCGIVVKQADQSIINLLRSSGTKEEVWELPLELIEHPVDGILTEDAIIDLELAFNDGSFYDKIAKKYHQ
jgi:hypothetical protein